MNTRIDYYSGFEGEPEINFLYTGLDGIDYSINMWIGYFDNIMGCVEPTSEGWKGLSYYYHTHTGWYEHSPWQVPDMLIVLSELQSIDDLLLDPKSREILKHICNLFVKAIQEKRYIWIHYN